MRALMKRLRRDAARIAAEFELRYRSVESERPNVRSRYGVCFSDGTIRIRLWHVTTRKPLKYSSLIATLCHELAHLRHFDHGLRFRAFNQRILDWARVEGIYRPGESLGSRPPEPSAPRAPAMPTQLDLF